MVRLTLFLTFAYFVCGYLGELISIPPSEASPIWPAAGLALAAIFVYGPRALLGVWLGAFLVQIYTFLNTTSVSASLASLSLGAIVSSGATLQAFVGAWLAKQGLHGDNGLVLDRNIVRFLLITGPFSCTVSASIGIAALHVLDIVSGDTTLEWLIWWCGDSLGVMIFAPILLCFIGTPTQQWRTRINSIAWPVTLLLLILLVLFYIENQQEHKRISTLFTERVNLLHNALQNEANRLIDTNQTLKALFESSSDVTALEFKHFTANFLKDDKDILAMEWLPRISKNLPSIEPYRQPQAINSSDFFPITYIEPRNGNETALGFNTLSITERAQAIQNLLDTAKTVLSTTHSLKENANKHMGVVLFSPVYKGYPFLENKRQRNQNIIGLVASVLLIDQKFSAIKQQYSQLDLSLKIVDDNTILFDDNTSNNLFDLVFPRLERTQSLQFADRLLAITYTATPQFFSWSTWWLMIASLLLVSLIELGLLMLTGRTLQIEDIVKLRTRELEQEINERKKIIQRRNDHNQVLQSIVSSTSLSNVLSAIVRIVEANYPDSLCSILILDETGECFSQIIAPSMPEAYISSTPNTKVGMNAGSCHTAAFIGERIIAEDITKHSEWQNYLMVAELAHVQSCVSEPILSSKGKVLGSFSIYHRTPYYPNAVLLEEIKEYTQLVSIAIEKKLSEEQIFQLAFFDSLTSLPNRRLFLDRLEQIYSKSTRHNNGTALLYLDLDHFKTLNDSLGHDVGDELLVQVAERLTSCIRDEDTVSRLGGDEFVLLVNDHDPESSANLFELSLTVAQRVQTSLLAPFQLKGYVHHISSSIGITLLETGTSNTALTPVDLLKQADTAMYHAKQKGRNTISFYNEEMQQRADQRLQLEQDIRIALSHNQFLLHYQPQFDDKGELIGAEALIRWHHPEKGMMPPDQFIPVAEETGLILAIGDWVLREACSQLQKWQTLPHLAVNVCPKEFHQNQFEENLINILQEYNIAASRLMLEITEGIIIDNIHESINKLQTLKDLGVRISIDDFGTGYSSLSYLKKIAY
ncbi:EAL domain-containing protein [Methylocucumis oryzae]|uniref:EAL domain-containing protein n=1 Tax=Methylocucumis oryzae TaxID=1632867 RepID=UPI00069826C6|nr:EAL domain-containing protein [Methylocucumis oryzae]